MQTKKTNLKNSVLVVNQLTNTLDYAIEGLHTHQNYGTNIKYVELGNEMYDNTRPDVIAKYPKPIDYAINMVNWTKQIKLNFPEAKVPISSCSSSSVVIAAIIYFQSISYPTYLLIF